MKMKKKTFYLIGWFSIRFLPTSNNQGRGLDLSYLSVCISVYFEQFSNQGYEEIKAFSYSTNIKYAVRFRSKSVWGGFVSWILLRFLRTVFYWWNIALYKTVILRLPVKM